MVQKEVQTPEAVSFFDKLKSVFGAVYPENAPVSYTHLTLPTTPYV